MKKKGMAKGGMRGGVRRRSGGGSESDDAAKKLAKSRETGKLTSKDIAAAKEVIEELNPGKTMDVTGMAMGGMVDEKAVGRMMGGGRPKGMAKGGAMGGVKRRSKGGAMGGVKRRSKGGASGGLNAAIKRVKAKK